MTVLLLHQEIRFTEAASTGVEVTLNGANIYKGDIETRDGALKYR